MRILVTGASGFAGRHLIAELSREGGHEITAGVFDETIEAAAGGGAGEIRKVHLDISSDESTRAAVRASMPDQVYHLAGQASVGESFREPLRTWEINATGTARVLNALREEGLTGTRVVLASSGEVYGAVPESEQPTAEERPLRPITPYGASKAAAEMAALQFAFGGLGEVVIARSFNHIGPGQDDRFVFPSLARQLVTAPEGAGERPVLRVGNLDVSRDFLDVRDAARAYVLLMERGESGAAYNVCSGRTSSLDAVVRRLVELSGTGAEIVIDAERVRPVDIPALEGDASRLRALGWEPAYALDQSLADLLAEAYGRAGVRG